MISEDLAQVFSNLKKDNVDFFKQNWFIVVRNPDIEKDFLSHCLEEKSWKTFEFGIEKNLRYIRSIVFSNAIRNNNLKILRYIEEFNLFDLKSSKASDLLNISLSMNDIKVIDFLLERTCYSPDILSYALKSKNKELLNKLLTKECRWNEKYSEPQDNPLVICLEVYGVGGQDIFESIIKNVESKNKMVSDCANYLKTNDNRLYDIYQKFNVI